MLRAVGGKKLFLLFLRGVEGFFGGQSFGRALLEFVHAAGGIHKFLRAGVKRMAGVADAHDDGGTGRTGLDHVAASATDFRVHVFGMYVRLHKKGCKTIICARNDKQEFKKNWLSSNAANPFAVFPHGLERSQIAGIKNIFRSGTKPAFFQIVEGVVRADGDVLQHAWVAVAVNHATRAAVADEFGIVPVIDLAHRRFPEMTPVKIEIPVEVKIFVAAEAAEFFLFAAQMPLHFIERFRRIHDGKAAVLFHKLDFFKQFDEFLVIKIHQAAVAEAQITARQRGQRITERAAFEFERFEKLRQFLVIFNQPAGRDARRGLNADGMKKLVGLFYFFADVRQAAILFVRRDVVRVNGHDDAGQTIAGEAAHVFVIPQTAVRADHRVNPALRRVARHGAQIAMHHRFAADEEQVADAIFYGDINDLARFLQRHAAPRLGIKLRARKTAETAVGIADVRDGELQITRPAVIENFLEKFERAFFGADDGLGKIWRCRRRRNSFGDFRT